MSQCSCYRMLFGWNLTSWTESGSSPRPASLASYKWMASLLLLTGSLMLWIFYARFYRREPALQKWNIFLTELNKIVRFWWSWPGKAAWFREFIFHLRGRWCKQWWHWCPWFPRPKTGCPDRWDAWCGRCELNKKWDTWLVPNLERFAADAVQDGQKARLISIGEHFFLKLTIIK